MLDQKDKPQKVRLKFSNGEEFEAEGSLEFIESQRDYFLALVRKKSISSGPYSARLQQPPAPRTAAAATDEDTTLSGTLTPRLYATAPGIYASHPAKAPVSHNTPVQASGAQATSVYTAEEFTNQRIWEQLLKQEGDILFLRRKLRLGADEAALLILGGVKILQKKEEYRALLLAKGISLSGFQIPRLDRQLAPAIKLGYVLCTGSKRNRSYSLTPAGFAHAFMLAQKKAAEISPL